jgi:hypothetical protein
VLLAAAAGMATAAAAVSQALHLINSISSTHDSSSSSIPESLPGQEANCSTADAAAEASTVVQELPVVLLPSHAEADSNTAVPAAAAGVAATAAAAFSKGVVGSSLSSSTSDELLGVTARCIKLESPAPGSSSSGRKVVCVARRSCKRSSSSSSSNKPQAVRSYYKAAELVLDNALLGINEYVYAEDVPDVVWLWTQGENSLLL